MERRSFIRNGVAASIAFVTTPSIRGFLKPDLTDKQSIKKVHLIFKTHLDIGFTTLAGKVIETYMKEFIPAALMLSENLQSRHINDHFVWTTGSWLIYEFLEKAEPGMRKRMEKAIERGDFVWHGLPFTLQSEVTGSSLFDLGIQLSVNLDKRFGKKTISAKMTDVPGHTRGIVPLLAKNDISFLHIGVNPACPPPDVPPLFIWKAPDNSEITVMYQKDYGSQMTIPGTQSAVAISFTGDNHGPQQPSQIEKIYRDLRKEYPNAEVAASTFNAVALEIESIRSKLPVVRQEIGDTWIHGIGSDPLKIAEFRELSRLRTEWIETEKIRAGDTTDLAFGIPLLMVAEHTWGLDVKSSLGEWNIYAQKDFESARSGPKFKLMEKSWEEKREYIFDSINKLPEELASTARERLMCLKPLKSDNTGYLTSGLSTADIDTRYFKLKIDPVSGSVIKLTDKANGYEWAGDNNPLFLFSFQTYSKSDYERFMNQYLTQRPAWAIDDLGKTGLKTTDAVSRIWAPVLKNAYIRQESAGQTIFLCLAINDDKMKPVNGSPEIIKIELHFPDDRKEINATLQWFNKPPSRLPEATWFSFIPPVRNGEWIVEKMGQDVNTRDIVKNGNRKLHSFTRGVRYEESEKKCTIDSLDAALVATGERNILNFDNRLHESGDGVHFCLHNNLWGTNYMMWFGDDMKYRFVIKV